MMVKMELSRAECAAMIEANITATWPCPPKHKWTATWSGYGNVEVECDKVEEIENAPIAAGKEGE